MKITLKQLRSLIHEAVQLHEGPKNGCTCGSWLDSEPIDPGTHDSWCDINTRNASLTTTSSNNSFYDLDVVTMDDYGQKIAWNSNVAAGTTALKANDPVYNAINFSSHGCIFTRTTYSNVVNAHDFWFVSNYDPAHEFVEFRNVRNSSKHMKFAYDAKLDEYLCIKPSTGWKLIIR